MYGHYQFKVMLFSLKNALVIFVDLMNRVFKPYLVEFVVIVINDILVKSKDKDEHTTHLSTTL